MTASTWSYRASEANYPGPYPGPPCGWLLAGLARAGGGHRPAGSGHETSRRLFQILAAEAGLVSKNVASLRSQVFLGLRLAT